MDRTLGKFVLKLFQDLENFRKLENVHSNRKTLVNRLARSIALIISSLVFFMGIIALAILESTGSVNLKILSIEADQFEVPIIFGLGITFAVGVKEISQRLVKILLNVVLKHRFEKDYVKL